MSSGARRTISEVKVLSCSESDYSDVDILDRWYESVNLGGGNVNFGAKTGATLCPLSPGARRTISEVKVLSSESGV